VGGSVIRRLKNHAGGRARQLLSARVHAGRWAAEEQQTNYLHLVFTDATVSLERHRPCAGSLSPFTDDAPNR
jgi:hypothetical protein